MSNPEKNRKIKETYVLNRTRRQGMMLKSYQIKIDESSLNKETKRKLDNAFVQCKWIYNYVLNDVFDRDYTNIKEVDVLIFNSETQKCDILERRKLTIGAQIIQSVVRQVKQNIYNLSKAKKKGLKVGELNFLKEYSSIPLKQAGVTYKILNDKYVKIQNIGKLKVRGLEQIQGECTSAVLTKKASGYFIKINCYEQKFETEKSGTIGLDFGIKDSITDSEGNKTSWEFNIPKNIRKKHKNLSRKKKGSKNYNKQKKKVKKAYEKLTNQKDDAANKFVHSLKKYEKVIIQDENIKGWQLGPFGKQVQVGILGRIKSRIERLETSEVLDRWLPTTKLSPVSFNKIDIGLKDREFVDGEFREDRDVKAAKTIKCLGLYNPKITPEELRCLPVEEMTAVFSNYTFEQGKLFPVKQEA